MNNYMILKVLNNNVILATDLETNQEMILVGKGIGFGKKDGKAISLSPSEVEKTFIGFNEATKKAYIQLIHQLDGNVMGVSEEIIALAESQLGPLNEHIHVALTDHIGFAIDRIKEGLDLNNPFVHEIKILYPEEYQIGLQAAKIIKERLNVSISLSEVGFITLHIHSARQNKKVTDTMKDTRFLKEIIDMIQDELSIQLDNTELMYSRLVNHLKVSLFRLKEQKYITNPLLHNIKDQFKESYQIASKIGNHIQKSKGLEVTEAELGYLALHIERINETKKLINKRVTEIDQA